MKFKSPVGTAVWPHLNTPDTKFDKEIGVYQTKLAVPAEEAEDTIIALEKLLKEGYAEQCKEQKRPKLRVADKPWGDEIDQDGNNTGNILFRFKLKAKTQSGIDRRPILVDSDLKPMSDLVGSGSKMVVSYEPFSWFVPSLGVGMTLRLKGVQVLELQEYSGGANAQELGFEKQDGFKTDTLPEEASKSDSIEKEIESHNGDF